MLKPVPGKLVVELIDTETTKSGIIVQSDNSGKAKIVAISDDEDLFKVGDIVAIDKFVGAQYQQYRIIDTEDVFAILEEDN